MEDKIQQPQKVFRLNLEKYGLTRLEGRDIFSLSSEELDRFLEALGNDDISVTVPVPFTPENIRELLSGGECRRCDGCCLPNPLNPDSPGVEVFEEELKIIARFLDKSPEELLRVTLEGQNQDLPFPLDEFIATRRLPLPCPFHSEEEHECTVYGVRPLVCTIYPVVFSDSDDSIDIKVNCAYGKEVARTALALLHARNPQLVLRI